jgi:hypothetical protein
MDIKITGSVCNPLHPSRSYLILSDGGISVAQPNDEITWTVVKGKNTKDISAILIEDDSSTNLFVPDPAPDGTDFTTWKGKIRGNLSEGAEENYRIYWSEKGKVYCYDPKLQINS